MCREGTVNGQRARGIILDTGCSRTMVHRKLVSETQILEGESAVVRCAHGDSVLNLMAKVNIEVDGCTISVVAAVSDTLPMDFLLGTNVPELGKLLHGVLVEFGGEAHVLAATTRAGAKQEAGAEKASQRKQQRSEVRPHAILPTKETQPEVWIVGEELDESTFTGGRGRQHLSQSQKREGRKVYRSEVRPEQSEGVSATVPAEELKKLQETDRTLEVIWRAVAKKESENGISFVMTEGLIYRVVRAPFGRDIPDLHIQEQLVLLVQCMQGYGHGVGAQRSGSSSGSLGKA